MTVPSSHAEAFNKAVLAHNTSKPVLLIDPQPIENLPEKEAIEEVKRQIHTQYPDIDVNEIDQADLKAIVTDMQNMDKGPYAKNGPELCFVKGLNSNYDEKTRSWPDCRAFP